MNFIELRSVNKHYQLGKTTVKALQDLSLKIDDGKFTVIRGQSGCGKSTLLNLIGCMDQPTSGEVFVGGNNVARLSDAKLSHLRRHFIGFIFQSFNLIPVLNARENVQYPLRLRKEKNYREKAEVALRQVGLEDQMQQFPNELSGGQQQRVAIARALVTKPSVILADEPSANLDSKSSEQIFQIMLELKEKMKTTFVVVSHHDYIINMAENLITMKDGKIIEERKL